MCQDSIPTSPSPPPSPSPSVVREGGTLIDLTLKADDGDIFTTEMNLMKVIERNFDGMSGRLVPLPAIVESIRSIVLTTRTGLADLGIHGIAARRIGIELVSIRKNGTRRSYIAFDTELLRTCRRRVREISRRDLVVESL